MFSEIKKTIKQTAVYSLGNISTKLVGFILLPLYTSVLSLEEYGILAILEITGQIVVILFSVKLSTAMLRWAAETEDEKQIKTIIFTTLVASITIAALIVLFFVPFASEFSSIFFNTQNFSNYFILLILSSALGIYNLLPLSVMRLKEKPKMFSFLLIAKLIITLLLNYYLIVFQNMGIEGVLYGQLIGQLFFALFSGKIVLQNIIPRFDFAILRDMVKYSYPLIFSTFFLMILTMSDRYVIKYFFGDVEVGIYSVGHKIASVLNMFILQSFQLGFLPIAYKKLGTPNEKRFFSKVLTYYTLILVFSALLISLFGREIIESLANNKDYWASYEVIPIIALAFVFKGIQYTFSLNFHYSKKTTYNASISIITAIINISLNIILIQKFGYIGAAYSLLFSIIIMMFLSYFWGQKVYVIPFEKLKLFKIVLLGILLFYISTFFDYLSLPPRVFLKVSLVLLFPLILSKISIFEEIEILSLKRGVKDFVNLVKGRK